MTPLVLTLLLLGRPADACRGDVECERERARATRELRRQAEYLEALAAYAEAARRAEEAATPHRVRHRIGADLLMTTHLPSRAGVVGYTIAWPVRVEAFAGSGTQKERSWDGIDRSVEGTMYGLQARLYALREVVSPYLLAGVGWSSGTFRATSPEDGSDLGQSRVRFHTLYSGAGLDLQWRWVHVAFGYRLAWAYHVTARSVLDDERLPRDSRGASQHLEDAMHGFGLELGGRF